MVIVVFNFSKVWRKSANIEVGRRVRSCVYLLPSLNKASHWQFSELFRLEGAATAALFAVPTAVLTPRHRWHPAAAAVSTSFNKVKIQECI